jgi:hypothetical protein
MIIVVVVVRVSIALAYPAGMIVLYKRHHSQVRTGLACFETSRGTCAWNQGGLRWSQMVSSRYGRAGSYIDIGDSLPSRCLVRRAPRLHHWRKRHHGSSLRLLRRSCHSASAAQRIDDVLCLLFQCFHRPIAGQDQMLFQGSAASGH